MSKKTSKVAVLMATYNGEKWLQEQIKSIINQKNIITNIYISDDYSDDNTLKIIKSCSSKYKNKIFIVSNNKRRSRSSALNFFNLIKKINPNSYDYISFSDQDDVWIPDKLNRAISYMKDKSASAYSSNVTVWSNSGLRITNKSVKQKKYDYLFESAGPGSTYVINKKTFNDIKSFLKKQKSLNKVWFHDWFIYAYIRSKNYIWAIDEKSGLFYRQHNENVFGAPLINYKSISKRYKLVRSGYYRDKIIIIINMLKINNKVSQRLKRFTFIDRIYLAFKVRNMRKSFLDQVALFFLFFLMKKN